MANKKMTYANAIDEALKGNLTAEVIERLGELKVSLAHKPSEKKSAEKVAAENAEKEVVLKALEVVGKPATVTEIIAGGKLDYSGPKVTSVLGKLVAEGKAVKTVDKKKSFYGLA